MKQIFMFMFILFLIFSSQAWATVYYDDATNGSDSNNGLTLATAWQTPTPFEGSNFLQPGDHVEISPNNTYVTTNCSMAINSSGTLSNPIVIERNSALVGTDPIFNCAENVSSIGSWTGWTLVVNNYRFTVTSANATVGAVYSNNGVNFTVLSTIAAQTTLKTTSVGAPTASGTLTKVSGTGDATISFSANTNFGNTYESNIVIPYTVEGVIIDGTYNLLWRATANHDLNNAWWQSGGSLFVNLSDGTTPGGHTVELVGAYQTGIFNGIITTGGNYISFKHLETYGGAGSGWLIINKGIKVDNSVAIFSGYAGFYCATHSQTVGCYNSDFNYVTTTYSNGQVGDGGNGENFVIEGSYNDVNHSLIAYGPMAGWDVIDYASDTPASYNRLMNSTVEFNSIRSLNNGDTGGFDSQIYLDGSNNIQVINNIVIGNNSLGGSQNFISAIQIDSEHPSTAISHDFYFYNNLVYGANAPEFIAKSDLSGGFTKLYNVWLIGNTFYGTATSGIGGTVELEEMDNTKGVSGHLYNNIFYNVGASGIGAVVINNGANPLMDSNYNDFISTSSTNVISSQGTNYTLSGWQSFSGQDANSLNSDPKFVTNGTDFHLQRTALGQSNNSPAIGVALPGYSNTYFNTYNLGNTRTDGIIDSNLTPDLGYHYNLVFGSSNDWHKGFTESYN